MDSIGKATIQSMSDVVQFDNNVTYQGRVGSDLKVDGHLGIRTLGSTTTENTEYIYSTETDWSGKYGGSTSYNSAFGFIDFYGTYRHDAHQAKEVDKFLFNPQNVYDFSVFSVTATGAAVGSSLDMDARKRIRFWDDATITMDSTYGHAKFYAHEGFVDFVKDFTFDGTPTAIHAGNNPDRGTVSTPGDLLILGYGVKKEGRSYMDTLQKCDLTFSGAVLFQGDARISFADTGRAAIRSLNDDVLIYNNFFYTNNQTAGTKNENGQFWMQAGQDILGAGFDTSTNGFIQAYGDVISFTQAGEKSIVMEAQKTIHLQQGLYFNRADAKAGSILLKAGYDYVVQPFDVNANDPKDLGIWTGPWAKNGENQWAPYATYGNRNGGAGVTGGGDIWFEGSVLVDLSQAAASNHNDSVINTMIGALHSVYIDSTLTYEQNQMNYTPDPNPYISGYLNVFAHEGNIEAIKDGLTPGGKGAPVTSVNINITQPFNTSEIRFQAGNDPLAGDWCNVMNVYEPDSKWVGNILFNKPLNLTSAGKGYTVFSAERDIETQVDAPFVFTYNNDTDSLKDFDMTAGRHIETHKKMEYHYPSVNIKANITMEAGRLDESVTGIGADACAVDLCKTSESGSTLTEGGTDPYEPNGDYINNFSEGGTGHGSILLFDSLEINYNGYGKTYLKALNGNIESDPYLHKNDNSRGNSGKGYYPYDDGTAIQHDAQITFNHAGAGVTQLQAININLHDKIAYYGTHHSSNKNGQFYLTAYDSILTRNIEYVNHTDTGSVFIITDKFKNLTCNDCATGIYQGHIVLGYGADVNAADDAVNKNDSIVFNFAGNNNTAGANLIIRAGYEGFYKSEQKGLPANLFTSGDDKGKAYGGNITFDFMKVDMAKGNKNIGGYFEMSTPNGNIWGKDSIVYRGIDGDMLVDAGLGSVDDGDAIRWDTIAACNTAEDETLNTEVDETCGDNPSWRTGNFMLKGGSLNFQDGTGNVTYRTREGYIDIYDALTVDSMRGNYLNYAGVTNNSTVSLKNQWGDVSLRDFSYTPVQNSGSVFFGADDNIMMNYGFNNDEPTGNDYNGRGNYLLGHITASDNPYYGTTYMSGIEAGRSIFNVNTNGYMWYKNAYTNDHYTWPTALHRMYRGCSDNSGNSNCSGYTGVCKTVDNKARDLYFDFNKDAKGINDVLSGGLAMVATNYIDMFTKFTYFGGSGSGIGSVQGMTNLHGESVTGYGLYIKSQFNGQQVEKRRASCENCGVKNSFPIGGREGGDLSTLGASEWTYVGFHDDARIHTNDQKTLIEAPVVEFFGHAELDSYSGVGTKTDFRVKADSLIFHDSAVFVGTSLRFEPLTTDSRRTNDMRYGVIDDRGVTEYYRYYGKAIALTDRKTPVMEFGYQRCNIPSTTAFGAPNKRSIDGREPAPRVGGDVIISYKRGFKLPIQNTVVANHARISFTTDLTDGTGNEYSDSNIKTDLLRIRNKVEFYDDPVDPGKRTGHFEMTSQTQFTTFEGNGMLVNHLHMEPGSELSLPGEGLLHLVGTTTVGGYGNIHEDVTVKANATIAPGYASLMEGDCQTSYTQGKLTLHNLTMETDAVMRISISNNHVCHNEITGTPYSCFQTDTLAVDDSVFFKENIKLYVMPEQENLTPGCYLFMTYGDTTGLSKEYVKNLKLMQTRFGDYFYQLDFSETGKVYLCITTFPLPEIQRYIDIPSVTGVTTTPSAGRHYAKGHQNFSFYANYSIEPKKVTAKGTYSGWVIDLDDTAVLLDNGSYLYTIYQVVEPWKVTIGPEPSTVVDNETLFSQKVWAHKSTLNVRVDKSDVLSIYTMTGVLNKKVEIAAGLHQYKLEPGVYVVTLKDGVVHKIVIN
jgi:hypothetical protein